MHRHAHDQKHTLTWISTQTEECDHFLSPRKNDNTDTNCDSLKRRASKVIARRSKTTQTRWDPSRSDGRAAWRLREGWIFRKRMISGKIQVKERLLASEGFVKVNDCADQLHSLKPSLWAGINYRRHPWLISSFYINRDGWILHVEECQQHINRL